MLTILLSILLNIFVPPVDYDLLLAGNFGEPRPNHFHGGLDVKTGNVEGKHLYAIADGYVSRVTVGLYGFGNAVYITHPSGQTSVYCHLKAFAPRIKAALRRYQYSHEVSVADARLTPLDVPVSAGQFVALSGNTGHSTGPHLHLELHDTRTWDMLDPYEVLADYLCDTVPPQAHGFEAIPQHDGTFNGGHAKQNFGFSSHNLQQEFTAWGRVGFALWANDYMQETYNHYGVRYTTLLVDGREVFRSDVGRVPMSLNRMVNAWGDYEHYRRSNVWYMKSFLEPACRLPMLWADENRGIVNFCEERDYHLEYVLRDYKGNESRYRFTVHGVPTPLRPSSFFAEQSGRAERLVHPSSKLPRLRCDRTSSYSRLGLQLVVPYGFIAADISLQPLVVQRPDALSDDYSFTAVSTPLVADAPLSLYVRRPVSDPTKLYLTNEQGRYLGGDYHDGWLTGRVRDLASRYHLAYDDEPPTVRPLSLSGDVLRLSVTDGGSGIATWTATVDDRFIVFDALEKSSTFACQLHESWLRPTGRQHRLRFLVTDNRQNTQLFETTFTY